MRVEDTADSIYEGLRALGWRRYLCAMWIVCRELQAVYEAQVSDTERSLMAATLDAVREAVMGGENTAGIAERAADLRGLWQVMASERQDEVMPGRWNTWAVFRDLAGELAGTDPRYEATERIDLAATDHWREPRSGPIYDDPDEEVDDSSPMARTLSRLVRAVAGVTGMAELGMREAGWDPVSVRVRLFG